MKPRGFTLIELLIIVAILAFLVAILFPIFARQSSPGCGRSCQSSLKLIGLGIVQYVQDYDEKYPPKALSNNPGGAPNYTPAYGWADAIQSYTKSYQVLQCPSETTFPTPGSTPAPSQPGYTDYWINHNICGIEMKKINDSGAIIMLGDGNDGYDLTDARYSKSSLPSDWLQDQSKPCWRHLGGASYAFADGHVKWLKPGIIENSPAQKGSPTFVIK